jgi:hypothetical protein
MEPTEEQLTALGNYRDIIIQHASKVAEAIGVSPETLTGWTEGNGEFTSEKRIFFVCPAKLKNVTQSI